MTEVTDVVMLNSTGQSMASSLATIAGNMSGNVKYSEVQSLTTAQKLTARTNINAAGDDIANKYSTAEIYNTGDYCIYNGDLYRCTSPTTGEWNGQKWMRTKLSNSIEQLRSPINIYCWGDSKTEGVGGWQQNLDQVYWQIKWSYPDWLGKTFNVINCGAQGEDVFTIMARQGTDPMVVNNITIPASNSTPVEIGGTLAGIATKYGHVAKPLIYVEPEGFNPVTIKGIEGVIYRELSTSYNPSTNYKYYFKRTNSGTAVTITTSTEVETLAMKKFRNGIGIIWMGANGGFVSHTDAIAKVKQMVEYGRYSNYIVIFHNEFADQWIQLMKPEFEEHLLYLAEELPTRGYMLAGICEQNIDTSGWSTTDPVKKNAPYLMEYIQGQSGEARFGTLHYSPWGYKAIAKLVEEKIANMTILGENPSTSGVDEYGVYSYKLLQETELTGAKVLDTKIKLYDDKDKNWTVICVFDGTVTCQAGYPQNILCCKYDGIDKYGLLAKYVSAGEGLSVSAGSGGISSDTATNWTDKLVRNGLNVLVWQKSGDNYGLYLNGGLAYGSQLNYPISDEDETNLTLIAGGRYSTDGSAIQFMTSFVLKGLTVYESALTNAQILEITGKYINLN